MSTQWDLTIRDREDRLVLVGEVKTKLGATAEWAAKLRRNIFAHGILPNAPFFLIVFPDRIYLWKNSELSLDQIKPTYAIDARAIFSLYFEQSGVKADKVSEQSFQLIVASWLNELAHKTRHELGDSQHWLLDSGLYDAIVGGDLDYGTAA